VAFPEAPPREFDKPWAATGRRGKGGRHIIRSLYLDPEILEKHVEALFEKFRRMEAKEQRHEAWMMDDHPSIVLCAYGTTARIAKSAVRVLRDQGVSVGLFRPVTAWPFPVDALRPHVETTRLFLGVEMSMGQMIEDVRRVVGDRRPVQFWGRTGGMVPTVEEIVQQVNERRAALGQ
jgi:2-oxoglutarate ferredoxin oxidoreductase subunit alpha